MLALASETAAKNADAVDEELSNKLSATASVTKAKPSEEEKRKKMKKSRKMKEDKEEDAAAGLGDFSDN